MVTIKQINPNSPRLGYEVQKGLIVDMPNGDGEATIEENDGAVTIIVGDDVPMDDIVQSVYDDEAWRVADEFYIDPNIFLFSDKDDLQQ